MRAVLRGGIAILVLGLAACGGGPRKVDALEAIEEHGRALDIVYERVTLPSTAVVDRESKLLEALQALDFLRLGKCELRTVARHKQMTYCDVRFTAKGERTFKPAREGLPLYEIPISYPEYRITEVRPRGDIAIVTYVHTAVPSGIRVQMARHGYKVPLMCGSGVAVFRRDGESWRFDRLQGRKSFFCVPVMRR